MVDRSDITPELCRQLLRYDPETGKLFWKDRGGREAFTAAHSEGYRVGRIGSRVLRAHRVAWAIHFGYWPQQVDHFNGIKNDNRLSNLREVDNRINQRNVARTRNNTSGHTGVTWLKRDQKWRAQIFVNGKNLYLGVFDDIEDARAARAQADKFYGFSDGHGSHRDGGNTSD